MAVFDAERLKDSAGKFAKGFTPGQKVVTGLLAAILVVAGIAYSSFAGKPQYVALFSNLTPTDASAITSKLTSDGVKYQLTAGGTAILVPQGKVDQERMTMATANLPAGGSVGLELMDKEGITTSQAVQSADYQRALQGELESTIGSISGVQAAQVTLALPQQSDFVIADDTKPQASVLVTMGSGQQLSTGQVTAVVHLVASSIPKLDPSDVTVVDNNGNVLAAPGVGITAGGGTDAAQGYEQALAAKITAQLDNVVGVGHANVQVTADVDTSQTSSTTETVVTDPKGKVVSGTTSSSTSTEKYGAGSTAAPAGVLGTTATSTGSNTTTNTTGTAAGTGTATGTTGVNGANTGTSTSGTNANGGYTKTTKDEQYALGKNTVTKDQPAGTVNSLHVAVLVDSASKANIATLTKLANTTAGINAKRGDSLTVVQMPFSTAAATAAKTAAATAAKAKSASATTGLIRLVVAVLGVLAMIVLLLKSTKRERREDIVMPLERADLQLALPSGRELQALPSARSAQAASELAGLIEEAPDEVAKVLRSWMHERSGRH
jgi:flagellar M-ring protein FliF